MQAFVTGGTGFIGSHLIDALLLDEETTVRALIRDKKKWLEGKKFDAVQGNLHDLDALKKGMEGADYVFHLAAVVKAPTERVFMKENVEGAENVLRIAQKSGVKRVIFLSSLAAAGPASDGIPKRETDTPAPVSMYGKSKVAMENMVASNASSDQHISIIRPPSIYGPREENIYSFFKAASRGVAPIVGDGKFPQVCLLHVRDLVRGLLLAADKTEQGVHTYFISSEQWNTWNEIVAITSKILGRKIMPLKVSSKIVKKIAAGTEFIGNITGNYPILNKDKANEIALEWLCTPEKAKKELGYSQKIDLASGIHETLAWYKAHHWI